MTENDDEMFLLGWAIIELKLAYYRPDLIHDSWKPYVFQPDSFYDAVEDRYRMLCKSRGVPASAADMVDADLDRPSVRLAASMLGQDRGVNKSSIENFLPKKLKK